MWFVCASVSVRMRLQRLALPNFAHTSMVSCRPEQQLKEVVLYPAGVSPKITPSNSPADRLVPQNSK